MWDALAEIVRPGMSVRQMKLVLGPSTLSHAQCFIYGAAGDSFMFEYWLDDNTKTGASGICRATTNGEHQATVLPSPAFADEDALVLTNPVQIFAG
jgi:hypothetical protein